MNEHDGNLIIVEVQDKYSSISNRVSRDSRLSWGARGILVYLLSLPADWKVTVPHLVKQSSLGRDGVYKLLKELEVCGYLQRLRIRDESTGQFRYFSRVTDSPKQHADNSPLPALPDTASPDTGSPDTASPDTVNPDDYVLPMYVLPNNVLPKEVLNSVCVRETAKSEISIESELAQAVRAVCKRTMLVLSPNDTKDLITVLRGLNAIGATVEQVQEFGRKVKFHWIGRGNNTPKLLQVLEYWQEVQDLPESGHINNVGANSVNNRSGGRADNAPHQPDHDSRNRPRPESRSAQRRRELRERGIDV